MFMLQNFYKYSFGILTISLLGFVSFVAQTQAFQYELVRTAESPGFFMLRVYPDAMLPAFEVNTIYIKNYPKKHQKKYAEVLQTIEELGSVILTPEQLVELDTNAKRILVLGDPLIDTDYPNLNLHDTDSPIDSFETFIAKNLSPVIIKNLKAQFGGNTSQIFSDKTDFVSAEPVTFVGKFEKDQKTRLEITADTLYGPVKLVTPLELDQSTQQNDPVAELLPEIWESYKPVTKTTAPPKSFWQKWWMSFLPTLLIGLAFVCFYLVLRWIWSAHKKSDQAETNFLDSMPPCIIKSPDLPADGLPFEIVFKTPTDNQK